MTSVIVWIRSPVRRDLRDHDRRRCLGEMSDWREIKVRKRGYISDGRSEEILPLDLSSHSRGEDELEQWIEPRRERVDLLDYSFQLVWSVSPNWALSMSHRIVTSPSHPIPAFLHPKVPSLLSPAKPLLFQALRTPDPTVLPLFLGKTVSTSPYPSPYPSPSHHPSVSKLVTISTTSSIESSSATEQDSSPVIRSEVSPHGGGVGRPDTSPFAPSEFPLPLMNNFVSVGNRESVFFVPVGLVSFCVRHGQPRGVPM